MSVASQRWLVTGASGFLGANLGAYLQGRCERLGMVRSLPAGQGLFDRYVEADLLDVASIEAAVVGCRPSVIVHTAAMAAHEDCEARPELAAAVNVGATAALARASDAVGARLVVISTDAVFDGNRGHYREDDEPSPFSVYGRTKLAGERLAMDLADALVVRTNFFGWSPTGQRSILEFFVSTLERGHPVRGFTDFIVRSLYAQHLAAILWELGGGAGRDPLSGVCHVSSRDAVSKYDFGVAVANSFGLDAELITPTEADVIPPRNRDLSLDTGKAAAWLGRPLPPQAEGIRQALQDAADLRAQIRQSVQS